MINDKLLLRVKAKKDKKKQKKKETKKTNKKKKRKKYEGNLLTTLLNFTV